ncbi:WD40 repeat domain-containing protein [Limnoglobus roseus]|nr:WD40 repeat domain-containing protein [Limnoglobus roseus]
MAAWIGGGVAILTLVAGGVFWMTRSGEPATRNKAANNAPPIDNFQPVGGAGQNPNATAQNAPAAVAQLTPFEAPDGSFSVSFPGGPPSPESMDLLFLKSLFLKEDGNKGPDQITRDVPALLAQGIVIKGWSSKHGNRVFTVGTMTLPESLKNNWFHKNLINRHAAAGDRLVFEQVRMWDFYSGYTYLVHKPTLGSWQYSWNSWTRGERTTQFVLRVESTSELKADDAEVKRFFDGFRWRGGSQQSSTPVPEPTSGPRITGLRLGSPILSEGGRFVLARSSIAGASAVGVWELETGNFYASFGQRTSIVTFGISPDGKLGASISLDAGTLYLWTLPSGQEANKVKLPNRTDGLRFPPFIAFSPDGNSLLTVYEKNLLRIDCRTMAVTNVLSDLNTAGVVYCPKRQVIAEVRGLFDGPAKGEVRVFDMVKNAPEKPPLVHSFPILEVATSDVPAIDISADGTTVAVGCISATPKRSPVVAVYDVATGQLKGAVPFSTEGSYSISMVRLSHDGSRIAASGSEYKGKHVGVLVLADAMGQHVKRIDGGASDHIQAAGFTPDGKHLVYPGVKGIVIHNVETGEERKP